MKSILILIAIALPTLTPGLAGAAVPCVADDMIQLPSKISGVSSLNGQGVRVSVTTYGQDKVQNCTVNNRQDGDVIQFMFAERFEADVTVSVANPLSFHPTRRSFKLNSLVVEPASQIDGTGQYNRMMRIVDPQLKLTYLMFIDSDGQAGTMTIQMNTR
jgi:hypothetical protein